MQAVVVHAEKALRYKPELKFIKGDPSVLLKGFIFG